MTGNYIIHCWWYNGNCVSDLGSDANASRHPSPIGVLWNTKGNIAQNIMRAEEHSTRHFRTVALFNSPMSQVTGSLLSISARPMTYQTQAIQWASRAKADMSSVRTTALYWEYRSSFCSRRSRRSKRTVLSKCTKDVCKETVKKSMISLQAYAFEMHHFNRGYIFFERLYFYKWDGKVWKQPFHKSKVAVCEMSLCVRQAPVFKWRIKLKWGRQQ